MSWNAIRDGAAVARVYLRDHASCVASISAETRKGLGGFLNDINNPHVLGLDAAATFFLEDGVILVEGQEDVIGYKSMCCELGIEPPGPFFGWGVGGAEKMGSITRLLRELGFQHVAGILDGNEEDVRDTLSSSFPEYRFWTIPANDVRTRKARNQDQQVQGLLDRSGKLREEHKDAVRTMMREIHEFLKQRTKGESESQDHRVPNAHHEDE